MRQRKNFLKREADLGPVEFVGGLDTQTPLRRAPIGLLISSYNYEATLEGGYQDITGYERFDGRPSPSSAAYVVVPVTITGSLEVADVITGVTSTETATVIALDTSQTPNLAIVTKATGAFTTGETLNVSGSPEATVSGAAYTAPTAAQRATYRDLAADEYRDDIAVPTGSGPITGLMFLNDAVFCLRANAGNTAMNIWKSTTTGWSQVTLGTELSFTSGGTTEITEGITIVGDSSGATGMVERVVVESGDWSTSDAAGRLILSGQTGNFTAENLDSGGSTNLATVAGDSTAITISIGGRYEFFYSNFGGSIPETRVYGCDGVNRGFEFDGNIYTPITTGYPTDRPEHVVVHRNYLIYSFGPSVQFSALSDPFNWTPILGAGEFNVGDDVTGFQIETGSQARATLVIGSKDVTHILYGLDASDFDLVRYRDEVGMYAQTQQQVDGTLFLNERGLVRLDRSDAYGNFATATLTRRIQKFILDRRGLSTGSCVAHDKNQYRVFFRDQWGLYITLDGTEVLGMMPVKFDRRVVCIENFERSNGDEATFFGSTDGYVYQLDRGTSFDGRTLDAEFVTHDVYFGGPRREVKYFDCSLEVEGGAYAEFSFSYSLSHASSRLQQPGNTTETIDFIGTQWDDGSSWDEAGVVWDGAELQPRTLPMPGSAESVAIKISKTGTEFEPVRHTSAVIRHNLRRVLRA